MATVQALIIGGGGGGSCGGGGAGGYQSFAALTVTAQAYAVTVGTGGAGRNQTTGLAGFDGNNSSFNAMNAMGGGGGGAVNLAGRTGGSGGGAGPGSVAVSPGTGTAGQGNTGGNNETTAPLHAGGGGGASAVGANATSTQAGAGGAGTANSISGASVTYAGGGGGSAYNAGGTAGAGGAGGGGAGNASGSGNGTNGTANLGGGGGGVEGSIPGLGGNGGDGVVIISYVTSSAGACTGGTITTNGANTVHTFNSSGTFTYVPVGVVFDVTGNSGDQAAASSYSGAVSWNGASRMLAVDVSLLGPAVTVTAMTYGGAACTFIGAKSTVTSFGRIEQWRILSSDAGAPAAGSNTLSITLSGSLEFVAEWVSYGGVHQTSPTEGFNSNQATNAGSATDATVVVTSVADNCWIHAGVVANKTNIMAGNFSRNNISGTLGSGGNEDTNAAVTPAGNTTMSYTMMGLTTTWAIAGYAIRPLAASTIKKTLHLLSLLGVGA